MSCNRKLAYPFPAMPETRRLLESASALSHALRAHGVPHAFHGSLFVAVLMNSSHADVRPPFIYTFPRAVLPRIDRVW